MDHLGLDRHDLRTYHRGLLVPHWRRVHVHLLELDTGKHISDLSARVLDGDVQFDVAGTVNGGVTRMLDLRLVDDQRGNLGFDPVDPSAAPIHRSRLLKVIDSRYIDALGGWVDCHVFAGPVWDFERDDAEILLTGHSMERQALGAIWDTMQWKAKKAKVTDIIRQLLAAVGDVNAAVPDLPHTIPHDLTLHPTDLAWPHIHHLAASVDHYVFYDGHPRFCMRAHQQRPVYHFHEALLGRIKPSRGSIEHNTWLVLGPNPHGPKPRPRGVAFLKGPNSPAGLARNGVPHHLVDKQERKHEKTDQQVQAIADRLAHEHGTTRTEMTFDAMPIPNLQEFDMISAHDDRLGHRRMRMRQWNIPLGGGDVGGSEGPPMTVGTNRRTVKARIRHP
jgi:hypothetical protein